ncbi:MAG: hypothetical protein ACYSUT_03990 [Planctomycetota bacterium]|jgi:hypothetical protein
MKFNNVVPCDAERVIEKARDIYKKYTKTASDANMISSRILGSRDDIDMLDYCIYELGFPEDNYYYASFIWGNVLQKNMKLSWGTFNEQYVLYHENHFKYMIFPYYRVIEAMNFPVPQFDKFSWLTEKTIWEISMHLYDEQLDENAMSLIDPNDEDGFRSCAISEFKRIVEKIKTGSTDGS